MREVASLKQPQQKYLVVSVEGVLTENMEIECRQTVFIFVLGLVMY